MKLASLLLTVLLSAAVAFGVARYAGPAAQSAPVKETRLEQIKRTADIICGHLLSTKTWQQEK